MYSPRPHRTIIVSVIFMGICGLVNATPPDWNNDHRVDSRDAIALLVAASYEQAATNDFWELSQSWFEFIGLTTTPTITQVETPTSTSSLTVTLTSSQTPLPTATLTVTETLLPTTTRTSTPPPTPAVIFSTVPRYNTNDALISGQVVNLINPQQYVLGLAIKVGDGWYSKPTYDHRTIPIGSNGAWSSMAIFTQPNDRYATEIVAYVMPFGIDPPLLTGDSIPYYSPSTVLFARYNREPGPIINFAGKQWQVKQRDVRVGPKARIKAPKADLHNYFSKDGVWIDGSGDLHLQIAFHDGKWWAAEVYSIEPFNGYGTIEFSISGRPDLFKPEIVCGSFSYETESDVESNRELDVEYGQLGANDANQAQYAVQHCDNCLTCGRCVRYAIPSATVNEVTHRIIWQPGTAFFSSYRGSWVSQTPPMDSELNSWHFPDFVDNPGRAQMRFNLWLKDGAPPADGQPAEVVITDYHFVPSN